MNANALIEALQPINIILSEESAGVLIEQVEEDFTDENLNYEDFLQGAYRIYMDAQAGQTEQDAVNSTDAPVRKRKRTACRGNARGYTCRRNARGPPVEETHMIHL